MRVECGHVAKAWPGVKVQRVFRSGSCPNDKRQRFLILCKSDVVSGAWGTLSDVIYSLTLADETGIT